MSRWELWPLLLLALLLVAGLGAYLALVGEAGPAVIALASAGLLALASASAYQVRARWRTLVRALYSLAGEQPLPRHVPAELAGSLAAVAEAMQATRRERDLALAAVNAAPYPLLLLDPEGRVRLVNAAAASLLGHQPAELVAQPLSWFLPQDEAVEALRRVRREGGSASLTVEGPGGRPLELVVAAVGGGSTLASLRDLTDVRRVDQVRRDFVANVSHELRTPLASLQAALEALRAGAKDDPQASDLFLVRAQEETERMARLVGELLELSRLEAGVEALVSGPVDLAAVMVGAVERIAPRAREAGLDLKLQLPPHLPPVWGDAERLERAVLNLLDNAIKFTPSGGSVTLSAEEAAGGVLLKVCDTGIGIEPDDLPRVFERFYKAHRSRGQPGAGLGLAIVKHIVEAHGGRVWAESSPGQGSTFSIFLPQAG